MQSFRFPFDSVLRWRKLQEAQEEEKLQRLVANRTRLEQEVREVESARLSATGSQGQTNEMTGSDFQVLAKFLVGLKARHASLTQALLDLAAGIQRQQAACREAQKRVELLESLRSKRLEEWQHRHDCELELIAADAYLAKFSRER